MKSFTLIAGMVLLSVFAKAQSTTFTMDADSNIVFTDVVDLNDPTKTQNELYLKAKTWFANTYRNANSVIKVDDPNSGTIIGNGSYEYPSGLWLHYTIEIYTKPSKYKFYVHDAYFEYSSGDKETLTATYRQFKKVALKNEKRAHREYDYRLNGALSAINNLKFTLLPTMTKKNEQDF